MPRPKGPGAIKFLDATTQDDVAMRNILRRGNVLHWQTLNDLSKAIAPAVLHLYAAKGKRDRSRKTISAEGGNPMARAIAKNDLQDAKSEIEAAQAELRKTKEQIKNAQKEMRRTRRKKAAFPWQVMAVRLIMDYKFMKHSQLANAQSDCEVERVNPNRVLIERRKAEQPDSVANFAAKENETLAQTWKRLYETRKRRPKTFAKGVEQDRKKRQLAEESERQSRGKKQSVEDGVVLGTKGATISTKELQELLRLAGFEVGDRELRRFMRACGVVGQPGKRTDLTSDNSRD